MNELDKFFNQLTRDAIGFTRQVDRLSQINNTTYPPHNIIKIDDSHYQIELACAGFSDKEIEVEIHNNVVTVSGKKDLTAETNRDYVYKSLAFRDFSKQFVLGQSFEVVQADFLNGLLIIDLMQSDDKKPKKIAIGQNKPKAPDNIF